MRNIFASILLSLAATAFTTSTASAADKPYYGICANDMVGTAFVGLPVKAQSREVLTPDIAVLVFAGQEDPHLSPSVVAVEREYFPELFATLERYAAESVWLGIVEDVDGAGQPALFMFAYANTSKGCVSGRVGARVLFLRGNAPTVFWMAIADWDAKHSGSALALPLSRPALP